MVSAARTTATTPALRVPTTTTRTLVGRAFHTSSPVLLLIVARVLWTARPPARPALGAEATMPEPAGPMTFRCRPPCAPPALRGTETGDHSSEQGLRRITSPIRKEAQPVLFALIYWLLRRMIGWAGSCLASARRRQRIERRRRRRRRTRRTGRRRRTRTPLPRASPVRSREGHGNSRLGPHAASSYSWMRPPRMSRLRTPRGVLAGAGGCDGASGARRSTPRCGRLPL